MQKHGGVEAVAQEQAKKLVRANYTIAINGGDRAPLAEPFISSLCSHANDYDYERENGLLSQWRGYGGEGRYALVFDTRRLDELLAREWKAHNWVKLDIAEVVYFDRPEILDERFPELIELFLKVISRAIKEESFSDLELFTPFARAATLLKHRAFQEEREVRIIAMPQSERALMERGRANIFLGWPPYKEIRDLDGSKKYFALFESVGEPLPITRIIVGPSAKQKDDYDFVESITSGRIPLVKSKTPFIG